MGTAGDDIDNLEQSLEEAQEEFTETALYSTEMVKCTIQATTAVLERNQDIIKMNLNKNSSEKLMKLNGKMNSEVKNFIDKGDENIENIEDEMSREIFFRLNAKLFRSLSHQSKSIRRNLLHLNNLVDQHTLQLLPYNSLRRKLKKQQGVNKKDEV